MPDLYLDVLCGDCRQSHDLYNRDPAAHARACTYSYTGPGSRRPVAVKLSFPEADSNPVPRGALPLAWDAD